MRRHSLRKRLFLIFLAFSLISTIVVSVAVCVISYHHVMRMAVTTSEQLVDKTANELDNLLKNMTAVSRTISRDYRVQSVMRTEYSQYKDQFSDRFELDAYLSELNQYNDSLFAMYFFSENGIAAKSKYYSFVSEHMEDSPYFEQARESGEAIWLLSGEGSLFAVTTGEPLITTVTPVKELGSGAYKGAAVVELEVARVRAFLNTRISENGFMCIQDASGKVVIGPETLTVEELDSRLSRAYNAEERQSLFADLKIEKQLKTNGWEIVCVTPGKELAQNIISITQLVCCIVLLVAVTALLMAYWCARTVVRPILMLDQKMQQVERGDLTVRATPERPDELGTLARSFNTMIATVQVSMEHEMESQRKLRLAELKALQAQIKPHFLYNTLDSIIWMIRAGNREGAIQMVMALTRFLKIGLSRGRETITVREELEHARNYLIIQNIRYKDKFTHEISAEPGTEDCLLPKLVLQPLIENAIYHGMKPKRGACRLTVQVRRKRELLEIDVADNGVGMPEEKVEALRNTLRNGQGPKVDSYGIVNVNERIQIMFGMQYGISVESEWGKGSRFRITIPARWEEANDESAAGR